MFRAMSSRLQRVAEHPWSAGSLLATEMTCRCALAGKDRRSAGSRGILKAGKALLAIAVSPLRDHMAIAAELTGDLDTDGSSGFAARKTICIRLASAWAVEPARKRDSSFFRPSGANEILGENGDGIGGFLAGGTAPLNFQLRPGHPRLLSIRPIPG